MTQTLDELTHLQGDEFSSPEAALAALKHAESIEPLPTVQEAQALLPEKGVSLGGHRLLARVLNSAGQDEEATRILFQISEKLNQLEFWSALVHLVRPMLAKFPQQIGPLLVRVRQHGGASQIPDELLNEAHRLLPHHGLLSWETSKALKESGDTAGAVRAASQALPELLDDKNYGAADECLLMLVENGSEVQVPLYTRSLEMLAHQTEWARLDGVLDLTLETLSSVEGAAISWPVVSELWLKHPRPESIRNQIVRIAEGYLKKFPDSGGLIANSRLSIPSESPKAALDRLRKACLFPPTYYGLHHGWGLGEVRENDIESIIIDFPTKPYHRMTMETAERALTPLEPTDLRVLAVHNKDELKRLFKEEPSTVLVRTLRQFKNQEALVDQIRKSLVPAVMASTSWAGWWKRAKAAAAEDSRIDSRRAYENHYRLRGPAEAMEDEVELPRLAPRAAVQKNLGVLNTFLEQQPDHQTALVESVRDDLQTIYADTRKSDEDRVAVGIWLLTKNEPVSPNPVDLISETFDSNTLSRTDQEWLAEHADNEACRVSLMNSRLAGVRKTVWPHLAPASRGASLLDEPGRFPEACLHILEHGLGDLQEHNVPLLSKRVFNVLGELIEAPSKETHRKRAMACLKPKHAVTAYILSNPLNEDDATPLISRLKQWRGSDKFRFPFLDFLKENGHSFVTEAVEGFRARSAAKLGAKLDDPGDDPFDGDLVLTRASLHRLETERTRLGMELKTTIPQTIESARELGDLKENAEYHAAKAKQAEYATRFSELENMLKRVRLVESLDRTEGVAFPGTEIHLKGEDGSELKVWLLGEGDQDLGEFVVSYRAPMGRVLMGAKQGETVEISHLGEDKTFTVESVVERLP